MHASYIKARHTPDARSVFCALLLSSHLAVFVSTWLRAVVNQLGAGVREKISMQTYSTISIQRLPSQLDIFGRSWVASSMESESITEPMDIDQVVFGTVTEAAGVDLQPVPALGFEPTAVRCPHCAQNVTTQVAYPRTCASIAVAVLLMYVDPHNL